MDALSVERAGVTAPGDFEEYYRRHVADVYRLCLSLLGNAEDAEDVTSTAFLRVMSAFDRVDRQRDGGRGYVFRTAQNLVRDYFRSPRRRIEVRLTSDRAAPDAAAAAVVAADERGAVLRALEQLSPRDRLLIGLRCGAGLDYAEVARVAGIRASTARVAVHRAIAKLREHVGDADD